MTRDDVKRLTVSSASRSFAIYPPILAIVTGLLLTCTSWKQPHHRRTFTFVTATNPSTNLLNLTAAPAPVAPGPFRSCSAGYEFPANGETRFGHFYVPALSIQGRRCMVQGKYPLLLIAHADGQGSGASAHGFYDDLASHLASNAIIVASMNRSGVTPEEFGTLLTDHVDYIYAASPIKDFVLNNVALLGHSAGGRSVIRNAGVIHDETDKELKAVILLAATIDLDLEKSFAGETKALLGINVRMDSDVNAYGAKLPGRIMQSTFKVYDEAGLLPGQPNVLSLEKDMILANGSDLTTAPHYFQNAAFAQGYINAFLQLHLRGNGTFRRFFKQQEAIPQVTTQVFQQHADPAQLLVADFENGSVTEHELGGPIQVIGNSIKDVFVGQTHLIDEFSCHHTQALTFFWAGALPLGPPDWIRFRFDETRNLLGYRYVALRITQVYDPATNPEGTPRDFSVRLHSDGGDAAVPVSLHGGELHFPIVTPAPMGAQQEEQTKNAMRTYLIPLHAFEGIDAAAVTEVILDFSDAGAKPTVFLLDDVAFWF